MEQAYLPLEVHREFATRIDAENDRQNHRIQTLEGKIDKLMEMTVAIEKLAQSTEQMAKELSKQGERLDDLEALPARRWNTITTAILSALGGAIGTALIAALITFLK